MQRVKVMIIKPVKKTGTIFSTKAADNQGDQMGRFFAYWVIINFGQFYQNEKNSHNFGLLLSPVMIVH
jgi:hypothetical protein